MKQVEHDGNIKKQNRHPEKRSRRIKNISTPLDVTFRTVIYRFCPPERSRRVKNLNL